MATITLNNSVYDDVKDYAQAQNLSVEELIVSLIRRFIPSRKQKKYKMKGLDEVSPDLQNIIGFAKPHTTDKGHDINGDDARSEYVSEKYTS